MRIVEGLPFRHAEGGRVVALGSFDGVHLGHRVLIEAAREEARANGGSSTVLTFEPMPREVLQPQKAPPRLSGIGRRSALIGELDPDELVVLRFDPDLAALEAEAFVEQVLLGSLGARHVVVGEDYRFGHKAAGDVETLRAIGSRRGLGVTAVPLLRVDGERVSSSWIRELVAQGEVARAARLLGRPPWLDGAVVAGDGRGAGLGVPTANLAWPPGRVVPARGVYVGAAAIAPGERRFAAAISVGGNPTFGEGRPTSVEAFLIDFEGDLYGLPMRLEFSEFLRHELRFESVDELVEQMWIDIGQAREAYAGPSR